MTKQEEFLWCVQTMVMLDSHNICLDLDPKDQGNRFWLNSLIYCQEADVRSYRPTPRV